MAHVEGEAHEEECGEQGEGATETTPKSAPSSSALLARDGAAFRDCFSKQMAAVREFYGLSAREAEVAELIAGATLWPTSPSCCSSPRTRCALIPNESTSSWTSTSAKNSSPSWSASGPRDGKSRGDSERSECRIARGCQRASPSTVPAAAPWCSGGRGTAGRGPWPGPC